MSDYPKYAFYQVGGGDGSSSITEGYPAGAIVFNKKRKEISIFGEDAVTIYAGGLMAASLVNQILTITDNTGQSLTVDLSNFITSSELNTLIAGYYTKTEVDNKLAAKANAADVYTKKDVEDNFVKETELQNHLTQYTYDKYTIYTKTETDAAITDKIEKFGDILTLRGTVGAYSSLPTTGNQKGDVWQVTQAGEIPAVMLEQNNVLTSIVAIPAKAFEANAELYWVPRAEGNANTGSSMITGYIPAHWDVLGMSLVDTSNFVDKDTVDDLETRISVVEELTGAGGGAGGGSLAEKIKNLEDAVESLEEATEQLSTNKVNVSDYNTKIAELEGKLHWAHLD
ncbi:MAG: hypothetical protein J6U49_07525 [Alistipes sp.]|nr:hypothetical protein [Alistipes sp.]